LPVNHLNQISEGHVDSNTEQVSRMILDYIRRNPGAGDTLEGITRWWLETERVESSLGQVADALEGLMQKGVITAHKMQGGQVLYMTRQVGHVDIGATPFHQA